MQVLAFRTPLKSSSYQPEIGYWQYVQDDNLPDSYVAYVSCEGQIASRDSLVVYTDEIKHGRICPLSQPFDYVRGHVLLIVPPQLCDDSWSTDAFQWVEGSNLFVRYLPLTEVPKVLRHWSISLLLLSTMSALREDWKNVEKYSERVLVVTDLLNEITRKT